MTTTGKAADANAGRSRTPFTRDPAYQFALGVYRVRYGLGQIVKALADASNIDGERLAKERTAKAVQVKMQAARMSLAFMLAERQVREEMGMPPQDTTRAPSSAD